MNIDYHNTREDALTDVLDTLQIVGQLYCVNDMKKPWAVEEVYREQIYFYVIEHGSGHIKLKNQSKEIEFDGGDLLLIASGEEHIVYNGSLAKPILISKIFGDNKKERHYLQIDGGGEITNFICGAFYFKNENENALIFSLPPIIHLKAKEHETEKWLKPLLEILSHEARNNEIGADAIINRLTGMIFVQAIRLWVKTQTDKSRGWLTALKDAQISRALNLLHQNPARNWTVAEIAAEVGMSRSPFAAKFTNLVGEPPLKYLNRWRMKLAVGYLRSNELNISEIAAKIGFTTVSAFSKNFKKYSGIAPRQFRQT